MKGRMMDRNRSISVLFVVSAIYDGILGLAFLVCPSVLFGLFKVTPPNHPGYVQFPAVLLIAFAAMFVNIARDPVRHRKLIPYGVLLKVGYCGIVFGYWFTSGIPGMWKPFAVIDLVMGILYVWAYVTLRGQLTATVTLTDGHE